MIDVRELKRGCGSVKLFVREDGDVHVVHLCDHMRPEKLCTMDERWDETKEIESTEKLVSMEDDEHSLHLSDKSPHRGIIVFAEHFDWRTRTG